ncbi:MAG: sodium:solute symporter family protein [Acidobacteria bacterium]|nr:sodium:solute symporter family protein [Acidobacteriota bacterium]
MSTALIIAIAYFLILSVGTSLVLKKRVKSGKDFVTGGGTLAWPLVMAGFVLAPLGSGHTLSLWEGSSTMGASVLWWGIMSGGLFVPLFILWFGPWFRRLNVQTFPEGMGKMFGEKIGWLISAVFPAQLIGICIAEVSATATAFYALSGGSLPFAPHCILLAVVLTILYIVAAGLMQVAWMNLFNAVMLIGGSFMAVFATGSWLSDRGGWQSIADFYAKAGEPWKTSIMNFSPEVIFSLIFPCLILTVFMQSASQVQNQPMLMARSESDIRRGVFWAALTNSFAAYPWVILALVGMAIPTIAAEGAKLSVPGIALMALPPWMVGILMISLLAATLSTTAGLILGSSHIIVHDIFKRAVNPNMSDATFLKLTRIVILVCAVLVVIPALKLPFIFSIFMWTFSFAIPVFGAYLIGMVWKVNKVAAWATILAGYAANFLWTFASPDWLPAHLSLNVYPTTFATLLFGIVLNLILPGEPGYLRQLKAAAKKEAVVA